MQNYKVFVTDLIVEDRPDQLKMAQNAMFSTLQNHICIFMMTNRVKDFKTTSIKLDKEPMTEKVQGYLNPLHVKLWIRMDYDQYPETG